MAEALQPALPQPGERYAGTRDAVIRIVVKVVPVRGKNRSARGYGHTLHYRREMVDGVLEMPLSKFLRQNQPLG